MSTALRPMSPRDPHEDGRVASSLELFFDLVFVVAVSTAASELHHQLADGHVLDGVVSYLMVFFSIWWAWMNFTWFATAFDTDDWLYRVTTFVQMAGVLVLAAGIHPAFTDGDLRIVVIGYVVMRLAMVSQWLRAARQSPAHARTARAYAVGITACQVLWGASLLLDGTVATVAVVVLIACETAVPAVAERFEVTPRHPHHITERYNLFTLIVLGESLLASSNAFYGALHGAADVTDLVLMASLVLVATAAMWWIYFWPAHHRCVHDLRSSFRYGYGHFFVLAAAAAFSAGVEVEIGRLVATAEGDHAVLHVMSAVEASFTVTVPIALFLLTTWWLAIRAQAPRSVNVALPLAAVVVLLDPLVPVPVVVVAVVLVAVVVLLVRHAPVPHSTSG
ncbi:low temperature requirement protein A [Nocardioides yefusunii]|uniref:Low temperature requirement protein A n=1 Tax=Nocardioides yefusunii TaxID=2500546 RepID=A0ABW1QW30_9ACTN|nr:low temperature requirement protein A [Nocardioides yefusunii]